MPLYEYRCSPCLQTFEALVRSTEDRPQCPACGSDTVEKQFSVPAAAQTNGALSGRSTSLPLAASGPGCGAPACCGGGCSMTGD